jgi:hypothetical protein
MVGLEFEILLPQPSKGLQAFTTMLSYVLILNDPFTLKTEFTSCQKYFS